MVSEYFGQIFHYVDFLHFTPPPDYLLHHQFCHIVDLDVLNLLPVPVSQIEPYLQLALLMRLASAPQHIQEVRILIAHLADQHIIPLFTVARHEGNRYRQFHTLHFLTIVVRPFSGLADSHDKTFCNHNFKNLN